LASTARGPPWEGERERRERDLRQIVERRRDLAGRRVEIDVAGQLERDARVVDGHEQPQRVAEEDTAAQSAEQRRRERHRADLRRGRTRARVELRGRAGQQAVGDARGQRRAHRQLDDRPPDMGLARVAAIGHRERHRVAARHGALRVGDGDVRGRRERHAVAAGDGEGARLGRAGGADGERLGAARGRQRDEAVVEDELQ
jgi:hypothetical protein